jgi:DeoR/GlpR family transcriptional regulator of sugar metabolism
VVIASREKLGAASPFRVTRLEEVDTMVVEAGLADEVLKPYRDAGITIVSG